MSDLSLIVRRTIRAPATRLFAAWTEPGHLRHWWGPAGVECTEAEVDLRVGGEYRIANALPDGTVIWIFGVFEEIAPPTLLVYSWHTDPDLHGDGTSRVTVRFEEADAATEVVVVHERIGAEAVRDDHERGWLGCLDGLQEYLEGSAGA